MFLGKSKKHKVQYKTQNKMEKRWYLHNNNNIIIIYSIYWYFKESVFHSRKLPISLSSAHSLEVPNKLQSGDRCENCICSVHLCSEYL